MDPRGRYRLARLPIKTSTISTYGVGIFSIASSEAINDCFCHLSLPIHQSSGASSAPLVRPIERRELRIDPARLGTLLGA
jgi:hypothetical protein